MWRTEGQLSVSGYDDHKIELDLSTISDRDFSFKRGRRKSLNRAISLVSDMIGKFDFGSSHADLVIPLRSTYPRKRGVADGELGDGGITVSTRIISQTSRGLKMISAGEEFTALYLSHI